jgi:hypothetical protein
MVEKRGQLGKRVVEKYGKQDRLAWHGVSEELVKKFKRVTFQNTQQ